MIVITT